MAKLPGGELPLCLVSEFPPPEGVRWIRWNPHLSFEKNYTRLRQDLAGEEIRYVGLLLQAGLPHWRMRRAALQLGPGRLICFNENLDHFPLHPRALPAIARHVWWRTRTAARHQLNPGGALYTALWRVLHPHALRRPARYRLGLFAARFARKGAALPRHPLGAMPPGISIVIPTRDGLELLETLLASLLPQLPERAEVILVDNGSTDGTAQRFPGLRILTSDAPLSFAAAVNRGIWAAQYHRVCLLNNDMVVQPGFLAALDAAFDRVPDLFAATAQIFFPPGKRREETGKAMYAPGSEHLPLRCELPLPGEDLTWCLYGSGGCTLYDTVKLRALGGFNETFVPAYVEDLDVGFRAWQQGWPTVFAASAQVLHFHRSTTARVFTPFELECAVEQNYLRFLLTATGPIFPVLWREALDRLNTRAARVDPDPVAEQVLGEACRMALRERTRNEPAISESEILALNSGAVAVFPGRRTGRPLPRVLVATPYLPFPLSHGGAVRIFHLLREAARTHEPVLLSFVDELAPPPPELLAICTEVILVRRPGSHLAAGFEEFDRPDFRAALHWSIRKWQPAVVQLEYTQMALYAGDCAPAKTVLVEHDITFDLYAQLLARHGGGELRRQYERWLRFETAAWKQVDAVVVMSERDRALAATPNAVVLPNGVDLDRYSPSPAPPEPRRLLFIGSFAHLPNLLALDFFLREVWPLLTGVTLHVIAGERPEYFLARHAAHVLPPLEQPRIELEAFVPDVRSAYERAAVVVAPLAVSAGTNIKVLEAMAMGKAIVATPAAVHGLDVNPGNDILIAATGPEMARLILELLADPSRSRVLGGAARRTVEASLGWKQIGRAQAALYAQLGIN